MNVLYDDKWSFNGDRKTETVKHMSAAAQSVCAGHRSGAYGGMGCWASPAAFLCIWTVNSHICFFIFFYKRNIKKQTEKKSKNYYLIFILNRKVYLFNLIYVFLKLFFASPDCTSLDKYTVPVWFVQTTMNQMCFYEEKKNLKQQNNLSTMEMLNK